MQANKNHDRLLTLIGHFGMLGVLALACWLWVERSTIFDSSLYSYTMIMREGFFIPHDRRINFLWQWIPILGLKLGVSLPTFMKLVSISPILFLYAIFGFIVHFLKHRIGGIYLVLSLLILTRYKFYSAISEIYLSVAFVALMLTWLTMDRSNLLWLGKKGYTVLGIGIVSLCYLGHPLIFYPLGVAIVFDYCMQKKWVSMNHVIWLATASVLFVIKYAITASSSHEGKVVESFQQNSSGLDFLSSIADLYTIDIFWRYVETQWAFPLIICALMFIYLLSNRKYLASSVLLLSSIVWVIFVAQLNAYLDKPYLFMVEGYFGLLALIILLPLLYIEFTETRYAHFRNFLALALIIFGLHRISSVRPFYANRMSDLKQKMSLNDGFNSRNLVFDISTETWDKYWFFWSVPFESLLLSSIDQGGETYIISLDRRPEQTLFEKPFDIMLGTDKDSIINLNPDFFNIDRRPFVRGK